MKKERTFNEWSESGFKIKKGSKSIGRNSDGECLFSIDQVDPIFKNDYSSGNSIVDCCEAARLKGTPYGVVEDFDSLVREASRPPVLGRSPIFSVTNPIEAYFLDVADKHGIVDRMLDEWENGDY